MPTRSAGKLLSAVILGAAALATMPTAATAITLDARLPECADARVLRSIAERTAWADRRTWETGVSIDTIDNVRQSRLVANGPRQIAERYCRATAYLTNGRRARLYFLIEDQMGFAGLGWYVSFCIPGRDYYHVYGGWCEVLRPR
ncbi:MAG: hypothetical protein KDJ16_04695 [Hyphomicrobiales bacterium]|nr:hypothetical protein [Hyphomicrobiales bacterium]